MPRVVIAILFLSLIAPCFASSNTQWRTPAEDNLVYLKTEYGLVVIELAPFIAPNHVRQFKRLVKQGYYDGLDFYRVIDGFVAQAGSMGEKALEITIPLLKAEVSRLAPEKSQFFTIQEEAFLAPQTGYLHGFAAGRDPATNQEWLLHCPGTVAMARGTEIDSASTEFYIVIGQAPRHLDRNMSSFGRVIYGLNAVQKLNRAGIDVPSGVIADKQARSEIVWAKLASDVPEEQRIHIQVQNEYSDAVKQRIADARTRPSPFFVFKGDGKIDLCYYPLKSRIKSTNGDSTN